MIKPNELGFASREDSDHHLHLPSLIPVLTVSMKTAKAPSYPLSQAKTDQTGWMDGKADLNYRWGQSQYGLVTQRLEFELQHGKNSKMA